VTTTYTPPLPPGAVPPPKKGGCLKWALIGCLAAIVIGLLGIAAIVIVVFGAIKSTDAYKGARDQAQRDPRVIAALGSPMETGIWVSGNVNVDANGGNADFVFPIHGPKGEARVHAVATRDISGWHYSLLTVTPRNGVPIDLLKP
jgi:hypothetical protein